MANVDSPFGLRPIRYKDGRPYNGAANAYGALSTYATNIFVGDPVIRVAAGSNTAKVTAVGGDFEIGTLPTVEVATVGDGNAITGVVVGIGVNPDNLSRTYGAASTTRLLYVADSPDLEFEIQADGPITAAEIGLNAVLIATHGGSTVTGVSGMELNTTTDAPDADASNQLTIVRAVNKPDNDTTLTHAKVIVRINQHTEASGAIGI
jgi:hypothetical protein